MIGNNNYIPFSLNQEFHFVIFIFFQNNFQRVNKTIEILIILTVTDA